MFIMLLNELFIRLCNQYLFACEKFARELVSNPVHRLFDDLAKFDIYISTRFGSRSMSSGINSNKNSAVPYLANFLTNRDRVYADFISKLSQMFKVMTITNFSLLFDHTRHVTVSTANL